jgi:GMP synthase (glutamine-hydrolysing)
MSAARVAFVISEHAGGLLPERTARYRQVELRLSQLARADVATVHYTELDAVAADATVLSGSFDPWSAHEESALDRLVEVLHAHEGPVLGICAGMQLLARAAGGEVATAARPIGPGFATIDVLDRSDLLAGLDGQISVWEHHTDEIRSLPPRFRLLARSAKCAVEALAADDRPWWGTQFHPEEWRADHPAGRTIVENFLRLAGIPLR